MADLSSSMPTDPASIARLVSSGQITEQMGVDLLNAAGTGAAAPAPAPATAPGPQSVAPTANASTSPFDGIEANGQAMSSQDALWQNRSVLNADGSTNAATLAARPPVPTTQTYNDAMRNDLRTHEMADKGLQLAKAGIEAARNAPGAAGAPTVPNAPAAPADGGGVPMMGPPRAMGSGRPGANPYGAYGAGLEQSSQDLLAAQKAGQEARTHLGETDEYYGMGKAGVLQNASDAAGQINDQNKEAMARATDSFTRTNAELTAKMNQLKGVDPDRWWNSKDTGGKILAGLAMGLGAFGAVAGKTGINPGMQYIQDAIHNDIQAQKTNLDHEWNKITKGMEINKDEFSRAQWESEQRNKEIALGWKKADAQVASIEASTQSAEYRDKATLLRAEMQKEIHATEVEMFTNRLKVAQAQQASTGGSASPTATAEKMFVKAMDQWIAGGREGPAPSRAEIYKPYLTGQGGGSATADPLSHVPKDLRGKAAEELEKKAAANSKAGNDTSDIPGTNFLGHPINALTGALGIPNTEGDDARTSLDAVRATRIGIFKEATGIRSPAEAEKLAGAFLPEPGDGPHKRAEKDRLFKNFTDQQVRTPILDTYGRGAAGPALPPGVTPVSKK